MSSVWEKQFKSLDIRTKYIVHGFIRDAQQELLLIHDNNQYYDIPPLLKYMILQHVFDYFMLYNTTCKIILSENVMNKLLNASVGQKFKLKEISISSILKWSIIIYPNGVNPDTEGIVCCGIILLSLPSSWQRIYTRVIFQCKEISSKLTRIMVYDKEKNIKSGIWKSFVLSKIKNNTTMNIQIVIFRVESNQNKILYQLNNENKYKKLFSFQWKPKLKPMLNSAPTEHYESEINYGMWLIRMFPNGSDTDRGNIHFHLQLCAFPPDIAVMMVTLVITCKESNTKFVGKGRFDIYRTFIKTKLANYQMNIQIKKFKKYTNITFDVAIEVTSHYDLNYNLIDSLVTIQQQQQAIDYLIQKVNQIDNNISILTMSTNTTLNNIQNQVNKLTQKVNQLSVKSSSNNDKITLNNCKQKLIVWFKHDVKLPQYTDLFIQNGFEELDTLIPLNMNDLILIGVDKLGHRIKIMQYIVKLKAKLQSNY